MRGEHSVGHYSLERSSSPVHRTINTRKLAHARKITHSKLFLTRQKYLHVLRQRTSAGRLEGSLTTIALERSAAMERGLIQLRGGRLQAIEPGRNAASD